MTSEQALKFLQSANSVIELLNPILGGVIALATVIVEDVRSQGASIGPFADEIAKFDAAVSTGIAADDAWRARHGIPPAGAPQQPSSAVTPQSTAGTTAPIPPNTAG